MICRHCNSVHPGHQRSYTHCPKCGNPVGRDKPSFLQDKTYVPPTYYVVLCQPAIERSERHNCDVYAAEVFTGSDAAEKADSYARTRSEADKSRHFYVSKCKGAV